MPPSHLRAGAVALTLLASCAGPPAPTPSSDMAVVLEEWRLLRPQSPGGLFDDLSTDGARRQPRIIDAARAVFNVKGLPYPEQEVPVVTDLSIPGHDDRRPARLYRPETTRNTPVVLMFPGGGWVAPSLDASDAAARALAARTGAIVLLVEPRGAPVGRLYQPNDRRFPAAHEDALAAYRWLLDHAREYGGDPSRIALAGEATGGELAVDTAIAARDRGLGGPAHLLLLTPVVGGLSVRDGTPVEMRPLTRTALRVDQAEYAPRGNPRDARLDPATQGDLRGLPPTTFVLASIDPARPGAERLAARLTQAGVPTGTRLYEGAAAGFFGLGAMVGEARQAQGYAAEQLRVAFARPDAPQPQPRARRHRQAEGVPAPVAQPS